MNLFYEFLFIFCAFFIISEVDGDSINSTGNLSLLPDFDICETGYEPRRQVEYELEIYEHSWLALLVLENHSKTEFVCEGTLISQKYVLTAAHCVSNKKYTNNTNFYVRLGEWNTSSVMDCNDWDDCSEPVQDIPIEEIIIHEAYDPGDKSYLNDIALIRLKENAKFNDFVKPLCIPIGERYSNISLEKSFLMGGWGKKDSGNESNIKRRGFTIRFNQAECSELYKKKGINITESQVCVETYEFGREIWCPIGSGGPLVGTIANEYYGSSWFVYGIESHSTCVDNTPISYGVFTNVPSYGNWILSKLKP